MAESSSRGSCESENRGRVGVQVTRWPRAVHVGTANGRQAANQATNENQYQAAIENQAANDERQAAKETQAENETQSVNNT